MGGIGEAAAGLGDARRVQEGAEVVVAQAVRGTDWYEPLSGPDLSLVLVITALGVLTMARVLARAVPLQEEVDATV